MNKKIIAFIPARIESKSIKKKNIKIFNGKPLIAWTIEQALASECEKIIVSTDSLEIKEIALQYGAEVPYIRDKKLSSDDTAIEPVILDFLSHMRKYEDISPYAIALLMPTSPFRKVEDINKAISIFNTSKYTSVVSVSLSTANQNPHWMLKEIDGEVKLFTGESLSEIKARRQELPDVYIRNDFIYLFSTKNLYSDKPGLYGDNIKLMKIDENRNDIDINTEKDWKIAEYIFKDEI